MIKNFLNEIAQVEWIDGRKLMVDTGYVLLFSGSLLVYFYLVDAGLAEIVRNIVNNV